MNKIPSKNKYIGSTIPQLKDARGRIVFVDWSNTGIVGLNKPWKNEDVWEHNGSYETYYTLLKTAISSSLNNPSTTYLSYTWLSAAKVGNNDLKNFSSKEYCRLGGNLYAVLKANRTRDGNLAGRGYLIYF